MSESPVLLVAVDFTTHGEQITRSAAHFARMMGARVVLLHVLRTGPQVRPDTRIVPDGQDHAVQAMTLLEDDARAQLAPLVELLRAEGVPAELCLRQGEIVPAIVACAEQGGATAVVIGSDLPTGLRKLFQGSVTEALIQRCPCPVLVTRGHGPQAGLTRARQQVAHEADG
ncbi:universal stress protein [Myxococcota bacterium]|nr:universal stress protein [Myxococcota bacterium]